MKALICGITGQDGSLLAKILLEKGYEVVGTSRDISTASFQNLELLKINNKIKKVSMALNDFRSVFDIVKSFNPSEIYNLAGQTSVGLSFCQPVEAMESITKATLVLLEVIRFLGLPIKLYNAGSSECFGDINTTPANEQTLFNPCSPYGVAKSSAHWLVKNYRDSYKLSSCTGILFNHESELRNQRFITQKVVQSAWKIKNNKLDKLKVGNIEIYRDWGWAREYVVAIWLMLQKENLEDIVIATGKSFSLREFIEKTFNFFDLDWKNYVEIDEKLKRPSEIIHSYANPAYAEIKLGWKAETSFEEIIENLCLKCIENYKSEK